MPGKDPIARRILEACAARGPSKSVCPSEIAKALDPDDWRPWMQPVRDAAAALARAGRIRITQKGRTLDPGELRGAIRLVIIA